MKKNNYFLTFAGMFFFIHAAVSFQAQAQKTKDDSALNIYRATPTKVNALIHTKLDVRFDYKKRYLYGKEWVTLKPHFYPTDSLRLDAQGMDITKLSLVKNGKNVSLNYTYDSLTLAIQLDKVYKNTENYTIYIEYTAKPDELKAKGSAAISDSKGLYFINPDSAVKGKPVQIWTQGETQSSSVWFPTIDKTNQKTTSEISMTVPAKYVTLSNGRLALQKKNTNGTRTDTWKMELPHAPYLFMMAVGDFKIYRDKWRGKEVNYYLEPKYAPFAKDIFGFTPEAMEYFSTILGVDYPWNKYSQIVVRDFVSGAMENTTATLHGDFLHATRRELADKYYDGAKSVVAHELFHHWFGDYVTTESWSNITVNESFANFSETLWAEHKYGQDTGDEHNNNSLQQYLGSPDEAKKDLVRFHYHDKEDVFDLVSYQKGGRVLNMLRNYLGAPAFYKGLNIYLKTNAFKTGEAQQLRLAMEEASGKDLNWFFNQWYYGPGHPVLDISYKWDEKSKTQFVYLKQSQAANAFQLPMALDIYAEGQKKRHQVWMTSKSDTLSFQLPGKPDLVNVDAEKILLTEKTDHKSIDELLFQYQHAPLYMDRLEAIEAAAAEKPEVQSAQKIILAALNDKYYGLQLKAIKAINPTNTALQNVAMPAVLNLAQNDKNNLVKAAAIEQIGASKDAAQHIGLFRENLNSQSYAISGAALGAISILNPEEAMKAAKSFEKDSRGGLTASVIKIYGKNGNDPEWPFVYQTLTDADPNTKFTLLRDFIQTTARVSNPAFAQQGIQTIKELAIRFKAQGVAEPLTQALTQIKQARQKLNDDASAKAVDEAVKEIQSSK